MANNIFVILILLFITACAPSSNAQGIIIDPINPTATIGVPPSTTHAPTVNCSSYSSCSTCIKNSECGWCTAYKGACIRAFNPLFNQGSGIDSCYGQADQFFLYQCYVGARTAAILAIGGSILLGFIIMGLIWCSIRIHRRGRQGGNSSFTRMVDDFGRKYSPTPTAAAKDGKPNKTGSTSSTSKKPHKSPQRTESYINKTQM